MLKQVDEFLQITQTALNVRQQQAQTILALDDLIVKQVRSAEAKD